MTLNIIELRKRRAFDEAMESIPVAEVDLQAFIELAHTAFTHGEIGISLADETLATLIFQMVGVAKEYRSALPEIFKTKNDA